MNEAVTHLTMTWVRLILRLFRIAVPHKYTDADPYEVLYIDPSEITHISGLHDKKRRGWVIDGDWDQDLERFMDQPIPTAIKQHYQDGKEWDETILAEKYEDEERFERKCAKIERLYDRIVTDGFRTQRELLAENPDVAWSGTNATISPRTNEITVDIGRDGEILWNMLGKHRLSIAKVADVEAVPVLVFSRHREWQNIRNRSGQSIAEDYSNCPDISE
ncbi:hypothetical protein GCM10009647_087570 [Streptomyces sanglieri]